MPSSVRDFLLVGLTGGIGSGKSAAADMFKELGRRTFSADAIAKALMAEDVGVRDAIIGRFGPGAYAPDGTLNRAFLANTIFSDVRSRKALERIVHPPTIAFIQRCAASLSLDQRRPYVVVEAALIYESGFDKDLDCVIVVDADEQTRVQRIMARDRLSSGDVAARMQAQMAPASKARRADFVIANNGGLDELRSRVLFIDRLLRHMVP
jgi:dephospho-CoA kinase